MKRFRPAVARPVLRVFDDTPGWEQFFFIPEGMSDKEARTRAYEAVTRYRTEDGLPPTYVADRLASQGFVPVEFVDVPCPK